MEAWCDVVGCAALTSQSVICEVIDGQVCQVAGPGRQWAQSIYYVELPNTIQPG